MMSQPRHDPLTDPLLHQGAAGPERLHRADDPMRELDELVISYMEEKLLSPDWLQETLADILDRQEPQAAKLKERVAELRRQAADADARLTGLYKAVESGVVDVIGPESQVPSRDLDEDSRLGPAPSA